MAREGKEASVQLPAKWREETRGTEGGKQKFHKIERTYTSRSSLMLGVWMICIFFAHYDLCFEDTVISII